MGVKSPKDLDNEKPGSSATKAATSPEEEAGMEEMLEELTDQVEVHSSRYAAAQEEMEEELRQFFCMLNDSNRKIKEHYDKLEPIRVKPKAVPSALGLTLSSASGKMKTAELRVARVVQEYHPRLEAGTVISQIPGPGAVVDAKKGITLVVSKGPPPDKEKYDTMRKRENVAVVQLKSRFDEEENRGSGSGKDTLPNLTL